MLEYHLMNYKLIMINPKLFTPKGLTKKSTKKSNLGLCKGEFFFLHHSMYTTTEKGSSEQIRQTRSIREQNKEMIYKMIKYEIKYRIKYNASSRKFELISQA